MIMEVSANMVDTFEDWVGKEKIVKDKLVAAIDRRDGQRSHEYRKRSRTLPVMRGARLDEFMTLQSDQRRRSAEPASRKSIADKGGIQTS